MSDQSPPPKPKPGSLRDRIAAFENKGAPGVPTTGPPPPRPKPSGLQWKPKPPSPTSPDHVQPDERMPASTGSMSTSDAIESIGRGSSLKERMAALQGKGAFGGPPPPIAPKPSVERPKWKPSPSVPAPISSEDEPKDLAGVDASGRDASRSPPPRAVASPTAESQGTLNHDNDEVAQEGDGGDPDPEEEERQRRAAIAARMARLGGARFGMAPPIFAPKPVVRKPESAPPAPEANNGDQPGTVGESSEASLPSHELLAAVPPIPKLSVETGEPESFPPIPSRAPVSMPMPVGPRRAAPPRKKASKNAPTTALPEPPVEVEGEVSRSPPDANEPAKGVGEVTEEIEATHDEVISTDAKQHATPASASAEAFHESVKEYEKEQAQAEFVESTGSHIEEESMHTATDDQEILQTFEEGEEEARRQRVAAKLAQMGAFNPLAGLPLVPPPQTFDEPASEVSLDVEDEVNVDTEECGETIPSPPATVPRHSAVQSIKHDVAEPHAKTDQDDTKVGEDDRVPAHRDGEGSIASQAEEQGSKHDGHASPLCEGQLFARRPVHAVIREEQGAVPAPGVDVFDMIGTASPRADPQLDGARSQGETDDLLARRMSCSARRKTSRDEMETDGTSPPRATRPPPPPPVNFRSKPTPPSSPPPSVSQKTPLQALRVDEEECPSSPDIPPRPIPPPGRSGMMSEDVPSPPRRSMPPPPRRTSVRVTDPSAEVPSSAPPVPTSPRSTGRRPDTPPIITTIVTQEAEPGQHEQELFAEDEISGDGTPRPDDQGDDESVRRRAIAERMARLGAIRFGGPAPMNPLSRPPLPAAPPPTSIPPDDSEDEGKTGEVEAEDESARKQRIAAKLASMGGMRIGMLPPAAGLPPATTRRLASKQEESESEDAALPVPAPPQRPPPTRKPPPPIEVPVERESAEAGSGSHGTSDDGIRVEAEESEMEEVRYSDAEVLALSDEEGAPVRRRSTQTRSAEVLPTPPPRSPPAIRPPIPTIPTVLLGRRSVSSSRQASLDELNLSETLVDSTYAPESVFRPQSEYVMVEAEDEDDVPAPLPRHKSTRGGPARSIPALPPVPPPSAIDPPEALTNSTQWELPSIPQGIEFGEGSEMASSGWSEDSTAVHLPQPIPSSSSHTGSRGASGKVVLRSSLGSGSGSGRRSMDQQMQLTTDELIAIWGKTGVRVVEAATALFDKSKRALVGDGSYAGFVRAVLAQVPGAVYPGAVVSASLSSSSDDGNDEWGYVVYAQTGSAVQRRVSDILPGDVIAIWDAKFKGHKGLHAYTQTVGGGGSGGGGGGGGGGGSGTAPLVGVVSEFDGKKSKVRVWQANQHVGQQTVELVSYRLEDMKSGQVKVYRVLEA